MRGVNKIEHGRVVHVLSNAEKGKISEVAEEVRIEFENSVLHLINPK